ncbi:MAG TPA: radical SAM protein [Thermoplasmata archaeon]|nr:radical SAM protein [Thermoplasmata archaeon]
MEAQATVSRRNAEEFLLSELYVSVQGESSLVGLPTIFVRLFSCNLRCRWCDSMHAVEGTEFHRTSVEDLVRTVRDLAGPAQERFAGIRNICWTGGEPLLQGDAIVRAIRRLPDAFVHSFETDGEVDLRGFDNHVANERATGRVRYVMDVKCPGSGMKADKAFANLGLLRPCDEVKFVLLDRGDYEFAKSVLSTHPTKATTILFSPATPAHLVTKGLDPSDLAAWILADRLEVRLQLQVHKVIWPGRDRGI